MYVIQRGHVKFEPTHTPGRISQGIMANVAGRDGRGRFVGVWRRVGFKQKVNFRGVETEFGSNWTPYE